jgi:hypothetical protein
MRGDYSSAIFSFEGVAISCGYEKLNTLAPAFRPRIFLAPLAGSLRISWQRTSSLPWRSSVAGQSW